MVEDINGNKMEAMRIFAMSIRYLKDHALKTLETRQTIKLKEEDILYVLTIPAIWDDPAKQFMREAAIEAGIDTIRLRLALEPEAASIWCQVMTEESKTVLAGSGSRYMVVDLGGGTADITVHEKQPDSTLKELHKASGGPWGGIYVDENYILWLEKIFGKNVIDRFKKEEMIDYFSLLRDFEIKKRIISSELIEPIYLRLPPSLMEKMNEESDSVLPLDERLRLLNPSHDVTIKRDRMRLDPDIVRLWFENPVNKLIDHIKRILNEPQMKMVNLILLVGGFGESQYVRDKFKAHLSDKDIIVPAEAGLVVLKGAVRFGHEPTVVSARVMQLSYGFEGWGAFDETRHPASKMVESNKKRYAKDLFGKCVSVGDIVPVGHKVTKKGSPFNSNKTTFPVFCSTDANPIFTTEPSCKKLGELRIEHQEEGTQEDKKHEFTLVFGETELIVKAKILKTGREFEKTIDCLK